MVAAPALAAPPRDDAPEGLEAAVGRPLFLIENVPVFNTITDTVVTVEFLFFRRHLLAPRRRHQHRALRHRGPIQTPRLLGSCRWRSGTCPNSLLAGSDGWRPRQSTSYIMRNALVVSCATIPLDGNRVWPDGDRPDTSGSTGVRASALASRLPIGLFGSGALLGTRRCGRSCEKWREPIGGGSPQDARTRLDCAPGACGAAPLPSSDAASGPVHGRTAAYEVLVRRAHVVGASAEGSCCIRGGGAQSSCRYARFARLASWKMT